MEKINKIVRATLPFHSLGELEKCLKCAVILNGNLSKRLATLAGLSELSTFTVKIEEVATFHKKYNQKTWHWNGTDTGIEPPLVPYEIMIDRYSQGYEDFVRDAIYLLIRGLAINTEVRDSYYHLEDFDCSYFGGDMGWEEIEQDKIRGRREAWFTFIVSTVHCHILSIIEPKKEDRGKEITVKLANTHEVIAPLSITITEFRGVTRVDGETD